MKAKGSIAAGHELTAKAGAEILRAGGNAYDAILASVAAACVCEPILSSFGGGGFLLASPSEGNSRVYDFFVKTPSGENRNPDTMDFKGIDVYYGAVTQRFHIGKASVGVPGQVRGIFDIHNDLGTMPIKDIFTPAIEFAKKGVVMNAYQAFLFDVVRDILATEEICKKLFGCPKEDGKFLPEGALMKLPDMADFMETLAIEGPDLFYRGEVARSIAEDMKDGGLITRGDLENYDVIKRDPLKLDYYGTKIEANPPPSVGGLLIAFGLKLLQETDFKTIGNNSCQYLSLMTKVLDLTQRARIEKEAGGSLDQTMLDPDYLKTYAEKVADRPVCGRGTTHISAIDGQGNMASMTVSTGEGSAYVIPGTGIQMNNMLGEEDLNPAGFHNWQPGERLSSMMAPMTVTWPDGRKVATGTGGANRIRTVLLQQLVKLVNYGQSIENSVLDSRIHMENSHLNIEGGFEFDLQPILKAYPENTLWDEKTMFFGGIHTVGSSGKETTGTADPRRDGYCITI